MKHYFDISIHAHCRGNPMDNTRTPKGSSGDFNGKDTQYAGGEFASNKLHRSFEFLYENVSLHFRRPP